MTKIFTLLLLALCAAATLCSCNEAKHIEVSDETVFFAINGGEQTIDLTADGKFAIKGCPDWLTAVADKTTLTFIAEENTTGAVRECVVLLVGKDVEVPVTIKQADKCTFIRVSETEVTFPKEGGEQVLTVETDGRIAMTAPDGVEAKLAGNKLTISAPANQGGAIYGTVTLTSDDIRTEVKVSVQGSKCTRCGGSGTVACPKCGGRGLCPAECDPTPLGCQYCGGNGIFMDAGGRAGTGRITCPNCGGTGH